MKCREAGEYFPAYAGALGGAEAGPSAQRALSEHLASCAPCRAELAAYQDLHAALATLATRTIEPPAWLQPSLLDMVRERATHRHPIPTAAAALVSAGGRPRVAAAGGAILLAGLAAGAVVVRGRRRRRTLPAGLGTAVAA